MSKKKLSYFFYKALKTLGIEDYEINPPGKAEEKIRLDVFVREA